VLSQRVYSCCLESRGLDFGGFISLVYYQGRGSVEWKEMTMAVEGFVFMCSCDVFGKIFALRLTMLGFRLHSKKSRKQFRGRLSTAGYA